MAKGGVKSAKVRYDGLDVAAMVSQLRRELLGRRIINIYDGVSDADAFLIKLDGDGKAILFLESGIRFHTTQHQSSLQQEGMPSPFCSKLRKHLRGLRLERIVQLGNYDRVVNFVFGTGESRHSLILELYARGNLILTKASYEILALLRSHEYEQVSVKVGQIYPVTYATSLGSTDDGLLGKSPEEAILWAKEELNQHAQSKQDGKKNKASSVMPLKAFLLKPSSGVYHYGPSLLEHCILCADLVPDTKIGLETIETALSLEDWAKLIETLQEEGTKRMASIDGDESAGYSLYRPRDRTPDEGDDSKLVGGLAHVDKVLEEFQPHLLKQHEGRPVVKYNSFSEAVDDFFAHLGGQKQTLRAEAAEAQAYQKLDKVRKDQQQRVDALQREQEKLMEHAQLIESHAEDVDKALSVINSALDTGMDWDALEQLVEVEQVNENPIALLIKSLELDQDAMILSLPNKSTGEGSNGRVPHVNVTINLQESAHGNARNMFAKYRAYKEKSVKTLEASTKALKAAELTAQKQLAEAQKKSKLTTAIQAARKPQWFEKFHWFITSDNYMVLGGRDAHQNETLVKRYLRAGDAYLHADVHGASSCILRAKRHRQKNGKTVPVPLSESALHEAGNFTICRSSAWASKMVTSAWWVEFHQVSKTAPTGEYLKVGSFMIRGKKNFLPPSQLEMGLAVLFRLGDDDSIARHKNERRDFALMDSFGDDQDEFDDEPKVQQGAMQAHDLRNGYVEGSGEIRAQPPETEVGTENGDSTPSGSEKFIEDNVVQEVSEAPQQDDVSGNEEPAKTSDVAEHPEEPSVKEDQPTTVEEAPKKKKGLSVKERKMIKKYGSLEAAQKAAEERENAEQEAIEISAIETSETASIASTIQPEDTSGPQKQMKRGQRGKVKKAARRYADQDDEDKELALLALHGGEKKFRETAKSAVHATSETQEQAGAETQALLVKDAAEVAESLPDELKSVLAECVTVKSSTGEKGIVRWDKFDADVIGEQLKSLDSLEQQVAAAKRLLGLKQSTRIDNFSASLSGIIRTIKKFGQVQLDGDGESGEGGRRKTKAEKEKEKEAWKETLAAEGIAEDEGEDDLVDDTLEISKLTGIPVAEDSLLYAVAVCAPYQTLSKYKYRVKLTPGNLKRGKASKQCVDMFLKGDGDKSLHSERNRELVKRVNDNDWVQAMCSDVKITAPGANKNAKKNKAASKKGKKG
jgi:predicted ribosome quality control (RQC) complex YloA/Tae2 family protein